MAPAGNWISFSVPHTEVLLRPCSQYEAHNAVSFPFHAPYATQVDAGSYYEYCFFPQAPKLEDLLGGYPSLALEPFSEAQDSSSLSTAHHPPPPLPPPPPSQALAAPRANSARSEVHDSVSETGNNKQCTRERFAVQRLAGAASTPAAGEPLAAEKLAASALAVSGASSQRTSAFRGVTRHRWTGRYEAHLWDNTYRREGQKRKGRQVYLGGYDKEEKAARAYDLAALKYWGLSATTNYPVESYSKEIEEMNGMSKQEFIASLRRKSSGFSRGASIYRGVTRHHQHGRWQARIGRVAGNKDLYLGTFATEEEAAEAYDVAAIKFRGANAVTNFELSRYDVEAIANHDLPIGGSAKRLKDSLQANNSSQLMANASLAISEHPDSVTSTLLHNLMQLSSSTGSSGPLPSCSFVEAGEGLCAQSLYWLTANNQHNN